MTSHVNMDQHKLNNVKALIRADSMNSGKQQGTTFSVEQTILAQVHYCRFLSNLYEEIQKDRGSGIKPPSMVRHKSEISSHQLN